MLQWSSMIVEWQRLHPGCPVELAYIPVQNTDLLFHLPGVTYQKVTRCPDGFLDLFATHLQEGRVQAVAKALGVDWQNKRLWYTPTETERRYAESLWREPGAPRVVVPWHLYGRWSTHDNVPTGEVILGLREKFPEAELFVLDQDGIAPEFDGCMVFRNGFDTQRYLLALACSADLFVGVSNHAFYAAVGAGVESHGVFTTLHPEKLFWPVTTPKVTVHYAPNRWDLLSAKRILDEIHKIPETQDKKHGIITPWLNS